MPEIIGSNRRCEYCDSWFNIWEVICPVCRARNDPIDVFRLLTQAETLEAASTEVTERKRHSPTPPEHGCKACVQNDPYRAKNCMLCEEADEELPQTNVFPLRPSPEKPPQKPRRRRFFSISAAISCFVLGSTLLAGPLTELSNTRQQAKAAEKEAEEQTLEHLWTDFFKVQADEGRDSAVAWVTELAEEEETKNAAGTILSWCRRNGPELVAFMKAFEMTRVNIGADGATALLGENYRTYMESNITLSPGGNISSVEILLSNNATFEATLFISEDAARIPEDAAVWEDIKVTFLGSNGTVLDTFDGFSKRAGPRFVCLPVDNEESIKIVFENCSANEGIFGLERIHLVVIGDPVLTPAYTEAA